MLATLTLHGPAGHLVGLWVGGVGFFLLLSPLFWVALVAIAISVARRRRSSWFAQNGGYLYPGFVGGLGLGGGNWGGPSLAAESTLAERFAWGDIDEKDYRARLEVLQANARSRPPVT